MSKIHRFAFSKSNILLLAVAAIVVVFATDYVRISNYKTYPLQPENKIECNESDVYYDLVNGVPVEDWSRLDGTLQFIENEYDCSDFRLVNLIRILYEFEDKIPETYKNKIKNVLLNFQYWWHQPVGNSMCYWSENHQILFASAEYLIGKKHHSEKFLKSGFDGKQHQQKARQRILDWLQLRWDYGFSEFNSNVYYKEDVAALVNLIDFAEDEEIVKKSQIILDLLLYDVASQCNHLAFISASGRAYAHYRKGGGNWVTMNGLTEYFWGDGSPIKKGMLYGLMVSGKYAPPPVLKAIANDTISVEIRHSHGLNVTELETENLLGTEPKNIMMQWGMEAFTNPEVIKNTMRHVRDKKMFNNAFLTDLKQLDWSMVKWLGLESAAMACLNLPSNGATIHRGNVYTYRTNNYSMYTAQSYQVGEYADQEHVFGVNIRNHFSVFHSHPATSEGVKKHSPNYWVGYGRLPHAVQNKNINLSIYNLPESKNFMETELVPFTHAYFPKDKFDQVILDGHYAFGKKGSTFCAFIAAEKLEYKEGSKEDLIQPGKQVYWVVEAGSVKEDGSFKQFVNRIKNNQIVFDDQQLLLTYHSNGQIYQLKYQGDFKINNKKINTEYPRFDSPYVKAPRKPQVIKIEKNELSLELDFKNMVRKF